MSRRPLLIAILSAVCARFVVVVSALAQSPTVAPSPTATGTAPPSIPAPTRLRTEGRMLANPPTEPLRQFVIWNGIADVNASYELERSLSQNTASRNFQPLATVAAGARSATGTFEYDAGPGFPNARVICYRVRAVVAGTPGPFSAETCIGPIPSTGPGVDTSPTPTVPVATSPTPRPPDTGARPVPETDSGGSRMWLAGLLFAAGAVTAAPFALRKR